MMKKPMFAASLFLVAACGDELDPCHGPEGSVYRPSSSVPIAEMVVGAWAGSMACVSADGLHVDFGYLWRLCPNGKMQGISLLDTDDTTFELLDEGTYTVREASAEIRASYGSTVVNPEEIRGDRDFLSQELWYDAAGDTLTFLTGCPVELVRGEGTVDNSSCD